MQTHFGQFVVAIFNPDTRKLLGSGSIYDNNTIITCKHVLDGFEVDKLKVYRTLNDNESPKEIIISKISRHPKFDFAVIHTEKSIPDIYKYTDSKKILSAGNDLTVLGYTYQLDANNTYLQPRVLKGHVVRKAEKNLSLCKTIKSIVEISVSIPSGMSGGPAIFDEGNGLLHLMGITVGNDQHLTYILAEIDKSHDEKTEKFVLEQYGLIHSIADVNEFLTDMDH